MSANKIFFADFNKCAIPTKKGGLGFGDDPEKLEACQNYVTQCFQQLRYGYTKFKLITEKDPQFTSDSYNRCIKMIPYLVQHLDIYGHPGKTDFKPQKKPEQPKEPPLTRICKASFKKESRDFVKTCIENHENQKLKKDVLEQIESKCGYANPAIYRECAKRYGLSVAAFEKATDDAKAEKHTAALEKACKSMFIVKHERGLIDQCMEMNDKLSTKILRSIFDECEEAGSPVFARGCGTQFGMHFPEGVEVRKVKKPQVSLIPGQPFRTSECDYDCAEKAEHESWSDEKLKECAEKCLCEEIPSICGDAAEKIVDERIEEKREIREALLPWGKLGFKIGVDAAQYVAHYEGAIEDGTAVLDSGFRPGVHLALSTKPGLARWPDTNLLLSATLFSITLYNTDDMPLDIFPETADSEYPLLRGNSFGITLLDAKLQIPVFERNFLEIGFALAEEDLLWGKSPVFFLLLPANIHIGLNYQFQGSPITLSDRVLDVTDTSFILSSYTMAGLSAEVAVTELYKVHKSAEFNELGKLPPKVVKTVDRLTDIDTRSDPAKLKVNSGLESVFQGILGLINDESYDLTTQFKLQAHVFGEQRWRHGAITYRGYTDFYPLWKKVEIGGLISGHLFLGRALELYLELRGKKLWSYEDDNNPFLPDDGHEWGGTAGVALRLP